jgi:hypothetical protein
MILYLRGGLGNQMFIYGAFLTLENQGSNVKLNGSVGFIADKQYHRTLQLQFFFNVNCRLEYSLLELFFYKLLVKIGDGKKFINHNLDYYQSSRWLLPLREMTPYRRQKRTVVHLRLKDYNLSFTRSFDKLISSTMLELKNECYLVTDDYDLAKREFPLIASKAELFSSTEIEDFRFIAESSHVVLSDSSFSFTAAFIGPRKTIYYPALTNINLDEKADHKWIKL